MEIKHLTTKELEDGLDKILQSPKDIGLIEMIVVRPENLKRKILEKGELDVELGLIGDNWKLRGSSKTIDNSAHPDMQINIMNSRVISLIAQTKDRWQLAGDQLYIDLDLSYDNLPIGTKLILGTAIIEVTNQPHTGCKKFVERFGLDAMKFVNSEIGKKLNLRGINAKVIKSGVINTGDIIKKL